MTPARKSKPHARRAASRPSRPQRRWELRLYVAGKSPKSRRGFRQPEAALRGAPAGSLPDRGRSTSVQPAARRRRPDRRDPDARAPAAPSHCEDRGDLCDSERTLVGLQLRPRDGLQPPTERTWSASRRPTRPQAFEERRSPSGREEPYVLRLYVTGHDAALHAGLRQRSRRSARSTCTGATSLRSSTSTSTRSSPPTSRSSRLRRW